VPTHIAMTGEVKLFSSIRFAQRRNMTDAVQITLRGRVTLVGGIKEKVYSFL
jgi:ATP-dependent Lon protease